MTSTPTVRPPRRLTRACRRLVALAVLLVAAAPALGQGTSGELPDPISARDLDRYARRLDLSPQQQQAMQVFHDDYQARFRDLREGLIEEYLREHGEGGSFRVFTSADLGEARAIVRDLEQVLSRIRSADNAFFDQVQTVLAEDQVPLMEQVRQVRHRQRARMGLARMVGFMNPASQVDLGELYDGLDLPPAVLEAADPLVRQYERSLTSAADRLHEAATTLPQTVARRMEDAGLTMDGFRDRRQREAIMGIWQDAQAELARHAMDLSDLHRRTLRQLTPLLPHDALAALRHQYLERGYREVPSSRGPAARQFRAALALDDLDSGLRGPVEAERGSYERRVDHVVDGMLDAVDENRRETSPYRLFRGSDAQREAFEETMAELRARHAEINASAIAALEALLGPDRAGIVAARATEPDADEETEITIATGVVMATGSGAVTSATLTTTDLSLDLAGGPMADPFLPGPITERELRGYARRLGLDEEDDILLALHADYRARFDELKAGPIQAVHDAEQSLWAFDPETNAVTPPTEEAISRLYGLRRQAFAAVLELDAQFFTDVEAALLDDEQLAAMLRVRLARRRHVYNRAVSTGPGGFMAIAGRRRGGARPVSLAGGTGENDEPRVDVSEIATGLELPEDLAETIDPMLLRYEQSATDVFRAHHEAAVRYREAMDQMSAGAGAGDERRAAAFGNYREINRTHGRAAREARQRVVDLNRATISELRAVLPEEPSEELRRAYNRRAFPSVYRDPQAAEHALTAARALPDLTGAQRTALDEIAMSYRAEYDALCERMVQATVTDDDDGELFDPSRWQTRQERRRELEKLRFNRDELSDKVRLRLRSMLSETQVARIGGLAAPGGTR